MFGFTHRTFFRPGFSTEIAGKESSLSGPPERIGSNDCAAVITHEPSAQEKESKRFFVSSKAMCNSSSIVLITQQRVNFVALYFYKYPGNFYEDIIFVRALLLMLNSGFGNNDRGTAMKFLSGSEGYLATCQDVWRGWCSWR